MHSINLMFMSNGNKAEQLALGYYHDVSLLINSTEWWENL